MLGLWGYTDDQDPVLALDQLPVWLVESEKCQVSTEAVLWEYLGGHKGRVWKGAQRSAV